MKSKNYEWPKAAKVNPHIKYFEIAPFSKIDSKIAGYFDSLKLALKQARRKQLESGAAKTKEILKNPQQKGFYFFISKSLILTGKKHCGESRRCRNASAGPVKLASSKVS